MVIQVRVGERTQAASLFAVRAEAAAIAAESEAANLAILTDLLQERDRRNVDPRLRESAMVGQAQQIASSDPATISANNTSATITGGTTYPLGSDKIRLLGGKWVQGSSYPAELFMYQVNTSYVAPVSLSGGTWAGLNPTFEVLLQGDSFEFLTIGHGAATNWFIEVDGVYTNASGYSRWPIDGSGYYKKISFGSVATRRIRVHLPNGTPVGEIRVPAGQVLLDPTPVLNSSMVFIGDSITEGSNATKLRLRWAEQCAARLGIDNYSVSGTGASGYLQTNGGTRYTFRQRIADVLEGFNGGPPDAVVVAGGINDSGLVAANVGAEALLYFQALRAGAPHMQIFVLGPFWSDAPYSTSAPNLASFRDAIFAAADQVPRTHTFDIEDWYTDPARSTWFSGGGGDPHPNDTGHAAYGLMAAELIAPVMRAL